MRKLLFILHTVIFVLLFNSLTAQTTLNSQMTEHAFINGKEAFMNGRFSEANQLFSDYLAQPTSIATNAEEALFLLKVSDLYLEKKDSEKYLEAYLKQNTNSKYGNRAGFYLGEFYRQNNDLAKALRYFGKCKQQFLPRHLLAEYQFKYGLVLMEKDKLKEAYKNFSAVKSSYNSYTNDATYYCGYIHYLNGEYDKAREIFTQVTSSTYKNSIEHYNLQMLFAKGDLDKVQEKATNLYKNGDNEYRSEIARILGYINFHQNDVQKAADYYEVYQANIEKLSREDIYLLGESYYALKEYKKAADAFTKVATLEDELSQNAYNKLASCYIKTDEKQMARMAFESASRYNFDKDIQEEALFNYCKLTYELSYSPFNEIISAFEKFLELFPGSKHNGEAYSMLSDVFLNTNNYEQAYESLQKLNINNPKLEHAMQRVAYFRAIELFNDLKFEESVGYFTKSLENSKNDRKLKAQAHYWRGEAYFRIEKYDQAVEDINQFVQSPYAPKLNEFRIAHYSLGYAYFKKNLPNPAIIWFGKYATLQKSQPDIRLADTYNRLGDCYYLKRDFTLAVEYYDYAIEMGLNSSDYSYFQKAFCLGLLKKYDAKIAELNHLTRLFKESTFLDDAHFEKGKTYTSIKKPALAIQNYQAIVDKYKESILRPDAMTNIALIHYNAGNEKEAIAMYKRVVNDYPRSDQAKTSLNALKTIAIDNNSVDDYLAYTKKLGNRVNLSENDADSLTYISAEKLYMKGNVVNSKEYFQNYIQKFPNGKYLLNAHYYKADCHFRSNEEDLAVKDLEAIVDFPTSIYTEESLNKLAEIYYNREIYNQALTYFVKLSEVAKTKSNLANAALGKMRCYYFKQDCENTLLAANEMLGAEAATTEYKREAYFYKAKCLQAQNNIPDAQKAYLHIYNDTRNEWGAEAKYRVAEIYYNTHQPDKAVAEITDFIEKNTPHQYWLAKAFILLAQVSVDKGDDFQAKQYLVSVKDNYKGKDEIQGIIAKMIFEIDEREAQRYQHRRDSLLKLLNDSSSN